MSHVFAMVNGEPVADRVAGEVHAPGRRVKIAFRWPEHYTVDGDVTRERRQQGWAKKGVVILPRICIG